MKTILLALALGLASFSYASAQDCMPLSVLNEQIAQLPTKPAAVKALSPVEVKRGIAWLKENIPAAAADTAIDTYVVGLLVQPEADGLVIVAWGPTTDCFKARTVLVSDERRNQFLRAVFGDAI